jgi:TolB-like protein/Tfp pilus assembly protein PilF
MNPRNFFGELKRRNVYKVAVAYAVIAWLLIQAGSILFPTFEAPGWVMKVFVTVVAGGFPVSLVIAWAFEMTPQGMKRTENISPDEFIPYWSKRKFAALIVTVALAAAALLVFQFVRKQNPSSPYRAQAEAAGLDKSVAVLPFENATGDPNLDYLSDGVSESVIDRLSQLPQLKVIARSSSFQYRKQPDLKAVANTLAVQTVVTGRVARRDESYIIRVDLTDARADRQLWGGNFTRKVSDVQALQTDISREIADALRFRLSGAQIQQLASQTANPGAYELLLKGRFYFNKAGTVETHDKAVEYYEQAVAIDPAYALAYAELADSYGYGGGRGLDEKQRQIKRRAAAQKAFELDPNLAEAHFALANIKRDAWEWPEAEREYRRAIELNPNLWRAHSGYATYISLMRRHDEAIAEIKRARELDPLSLLVNANIGNIFYRARRNEEAIEALKKTLELDPNYSQVHRLLGQVYAAKGMNREAITEFQEAIRLRGVAPLTEALLGAVFVKAGDRARAEEILQKLKTGGSDAAPMNLAILHEALGDHDEALAILEKAYADRDENLPLTAVEPFFDTLRADPRLQELLRRMGLQP